MILSSPIHVHWELTNVCNLKCLHCYQQDDSIRLTNERLFTIAEKLIDARVFEVTLTGGEPFTVKYLPEIVKYFNVNGIVPHITSNGTLINYKSVTWLSKISATIQISLDSYRSKIHNYIRQCPSAYRRVLEAISLLHKNGIRVTVAVCANKQNYQDIEGIINLCIRHKVDTIIIGEIIPLYGPYSIQQNLSFSILEYRNFIDLIVKLRKKYHSQINVQINTEWGFIFSKEIEHSPCTAMDRDMAILYDGQIYPCPFIRSKAYSMGSLLELDIKSIWRSEKAMRFRSQKHLGCANDCQYYGICMGGCKALLANKGLPLTEKDPHCPLHLL